MSGNFELGRTGARDRPFAVESGDGGRSTLGSENQHYSTSGCYEVQ
ncbi:hypothetical protein QUA82_30530 [Microcoleus sp. F8-D3]